MGEVLKTTMTTLSSQSPDFKNALKILIKFEIYTLLQRLSDVGEEAVIITASPYDGANGHLGTDRGEDFMKQSQDINKLKEQFLTYCYASRNESPNVQKNIGAKQPLAEETDVLIGHDFDTTDLVHEQLESTDTEVDSCGVQVDSVGESTVLCASCGELCDSDLNTGHAASCEMNEQLVSDNDHTCILNTEQSHNQDHCQNATRFNSAFDEKHIKEMHQSSVQSPIQTMKPGYIDKVIVEVIGALNDASPDTPITKYVGSDSIGTSIIKPKSQRTEDKTADAEITNNIDARSNKIDPRCEQKTQSLSTPANTIGHGEFEMSTKSTSVQSPRKGSDDRSASEIIQTMHAYLKKKRTEPEPSSNVSSSPLVLGKTQHLS